MNAGQAGPKLYGNMKNSFKLYSTAVIAAIYALLAANCGKQPMDASYYHRRGIAYYKNGHINRAIINYFKALKIDENFPECYKDLGNAFRDRNSYQNAMNSYVLAAELDPDFPNAYLGIGDVYSDLGRYEMAIDAYNKTVALDPICKNAYNNRGLAYYRMGRCDDALVDYNKCLEIDPELQFAHNNRALAEQNKGNFEEAVQDFKKEIELYPDNVEAYKNLADCYLEMTEYRHAENYYERVIQMDPHDFGAWEKLKICRFYINNSNYDTVNKDKEISGRIDAVVGYSKMGDYYFDRRDYQKALAEYDKALAIGTDYSLVRFSKALCYYRLGQIENFITECDSIFKIDPESYFALQGRALILFSQSKFDEAIDQYCEVIEHNTADAGQYVGRGNCYKAINQRILAIADYNRALEYDQSRIDLYYYLGKLNKDIGANEEAIEAFETFIALNDPAGQNADYIEIAKRDLKKLGWQDMINLAGY